MPLDRSDVTHVVSLIYCLIIDNRAGLEAPGLEAPGLEAPGLEAPGLEAPGLEAPGLEAPGLEAPGLEAPGLEAPDSGVRRRIHTAICLWYTLTNAKNRRPWRAPLWRYILFFTGMFPVGDTSCRTLIAVCVCLSVCLSVCVSVCPPTYR